MLRNNKVESLPVSIKRIISNNRPYFYGIHPIDEYNDVIVTNNPSRVTLLVKSKRDRGKIVIVLSTILEDFKTETGCWCLRAKTMDSGIYKITIAHSTENETAFSGKLAAEQHENMVLLENTYNEFIRVVDKKKNSDKNFYHKNEIEIDCNFYHQDILFDNDMLNRITDCCFDDRKPGKSHCFASMLILNGPMETYQLTLLRKQTDDPKLGEEYLAEHEDEKENEMSCDEDHVCEKGKPTSILGRLCTLAVPLISMLIVTHWICVSYDSGINHVLSSMDVIN